MERKYWIVNKDLQFLTQAVNGSYWENDITKGTKYTFHIAQAIMNSLTLNIKDWDNVQAHLVEAKELTYENVIGYLQLLKKYEVSFRYTINKYTEDNNRLCVYEVNDPDEPIYWKNIKALSKLLVSHVLEVIEDTCIKHTVKGNVIVNLENGNIEVKYIDQEGEEGVFTFLG